MIMGENGESEIPVKISEGEEVKTERNVQKKHKIMTAVVLEGVTVRQELKSSRTGRRMQQAVQDCK